MREAAIFPADKPAPVNPANDVYVLDAKRWGVEDPFLDEDIEASAHLTFGIEHMHPFQKQVVRALMTGHDALVIQPTAAGKSLCYQLPAFMMRGTVLVISPLVSLMEQQSNNLNRLGLNTAFLISDIDSSLANRIERQFEKGVLDLLFVAPERLNSQHFIELAQKSPISLLAIDEAHCLTTWGHDFRPDYAKIGQFISCLARGGNLPGRQEGKALRPPILALTATADRQTSLEIRQQLDISTADGPEAPCLVCSLPDRPNLRVSVGYRRNGYKQVLGHLQDRFAGQRGIIYCPTRSLVERLTTAINQNHVSALPYHAGLNRDVRSQNQALFEAGQVDVVVATLAFGMGIDAPDLGFVIRLGLPQTLEAFLQEAGRAGRDGREAEVLTLFNERDAAWIWSRMDSLDVNPANEILHAQILQKNERRLGALVELLQGQTCIRDLLNRHFSIIENVKISSDTSKVDGRRKAVDCGCPSCTATRIQFDESETVKALILHAFKALPERATPATLVDLLIGKDNPKLTAMAMDTSHLFGTLTGTPRISLMVAVRDLIATRELRLDLETGLLG